MSGEYPGRSFEELRNRDAGFRNPDAEYRNPDAEYRSSRRDEDRVPTPEEPGKPVYQPDHTEVREALVKEDLKPSDGWSFGSSAAENTDIPKEREAAEITDRNDEES